MSASAPVTIIQWQQLFDLTFLGPNKVKPVCIIAPNAAFISYAQNNALYIKGLVSGTSGVYDVNAFGTLYQQPNNTSQYFVILDIPFTSTPSTLGTYTLDVTYQNPNVTIQIATNLTAQNLNNTTLNVTNATTTNLTVSTNLT